MPSPTTRAFHILLLALGSALPVVAQELVAAARDARAAATPNTIAWVHRRISEGCVLSRFDMTAADAVLGDALAVATDLGAGAEQAIALASLARVKAKTVGAAAAKALLSRAEAVLPEHAPLRAVAIVEYSRAVTQWLFDEVPESMASWRRATDAAEEARDLGMRGYCELLAQNLIDYEDDALAELDRIDRMFATAGEECGCLEVAMRRAEVLRRRGHDHDEVLAIVRRTVDRARALGDRALYAYGTYALARLAAPTAAADDRAPYDQAVAIARELGDCECIGLAQQGRGEFLVGCGFIAEGRAALDEAAALFHRIGMRVRELGVQHGILHVASATGDGKAAQTSAERISELERALTGTASDRARYWRAYSGIRSEFREAQRAHELEMARLGSRLERVTWVSVAILALVGIGASALLFRAKRRLERANTRLCREVAATARAQQESAALQESLRQLERLDSIGVLAGGFAHDFNNILLAVQGNAQLAMAAVTDARAVGGALQEIVDASSRATKLCKDILAYSRAGRGEFRDCDIRELIEGLLPIARSGLGAGVALEFAPGGDDLIVHADVTKLEQVFLNMLINAGEAIAERGCIRIAIGTTVLGGRPANGNWFGDFPAAPREHVTVTICDDGHGIDAATVRRIFDPFFSTRFPGRGMGLAAAYGNVRRHDGLIEVESESGRGSRFAVHLPRVQKESSPPASEPAVVLSPAPRPLSGSEPPVGASVLVVDDEPAVREVARRLLVQAGYRPIVAASGRVAIASLTTEAADATIALVDFTMPEMNGAAVAVALRAVRPQLSVVITSGHDEAALRGLPPFAAFLPKPYGVAELQAAIRAARDLAVDVLAPPPGTEPLSVVAGSPA